MQALAELLNLAVLIAIIGGALLLVGLGGTAMRDADNTRRYAAQQRRRRGG